MSYVEMQTAVVGDIVTRYVAEVAITRANGDRVYFDTTFYSSRLTADTWENISKDVSDTFLIVDGERPVEVEVQNITAADEE